MLCLAAHLLAYAPPVKVQEPVNGVSADCSTSHLEVDCQVTGLPVIDNIGFDAGIDGNPASLDFHIMGDPNPALESVAYSNYKAGATIDPSVFTLPDVCHQGTANRYHGGGARQALDLLLRR